MTDADRIINNQAGIMDALACLLIAVVAPKADGMKDAAMRVADHLREASQLNKDYARRNEHGQVQH